MLEYRTRNDDLGRLASLTERELEVLRLVGLGRNTSDMSRELHRSIKTIDGHLLSIRNKLGERSRVELARLAMHCGLTQLQPDELRVIARQSHASDRHATNPELSGI